MMLDEHASGSPTRDHGPRFRAVLSAGALAAGLALGRAEMLPGDSAWWLGLAAGLGAAAALARGWWWRGLVLLALVALGVGWWNLRVREAPPPLLREASPVALHGLVASVPRVDLGERGSISGRGSGPTTRFTLRLLSVDTDAGSVPLRGRVDVVLREVARDLTMGSAVRVRGLFEPVPAPSNPGERDQRPAANMDGRAGRVELDSADLLRASDHPLSTLDRAEQAWLRLLGTLRVRAAETLDDAVGGLDDPSARSLLAALLIGSEDRALAPVTDAFGRLGLVHVLSISGFHLVVMAGVALAAVRLTGDSGALEPALVALAVVTYLLIVPAEAPVVRSGLMVLTLLAVEATGRRYDSVAVLGWLAALLLLWRPTDVASAGFQLSFGVTGALLWLAPRWQAALTRPALIADADPLRLDPANRPAGQRLRQAIAGGLAASVIAWAVSAPVVMVHAGIFSPLAWLTGLVLVPVFVVLLWLGFFALLAGTLVPALAAASGWAMGLLAHAALALVWWLDGSRWMAWPVPAIAGAEAWALVASVLIAAGLSGWGLKRAGWWWLVAGALAWLAGVLALAGSGLPAGIAARVDALSVGPGSATIIRAGREAAAWSMGSGWRGTVRRVVPNAARALGVPRVRVVVVPSTDPAFFAGLAEVAPFLDVRDVLVPEGFHALATDRPDGEHARLIRAMDARGIRVSPARAGDVVDLGPARLELHAPTLGPGRPVLAGLLRTDGHDRPVALAGALRADEAHAWIATLGPLESAQFPAGYAPARAAEWLASGQLKSAWRSTLTPGWGDAPLTPVPGFSDTGLHGSVAIELLAPDAQPSRSRVTRFADR
jgi:ComEC/Rec2-related protein